VSVTLDARGTLYTLDHEEDEYAYDTRLLTLQVHDGHLYFDVRRKEAVELWRVRLDGGAPRHVLDVAVPSADVYNLRATTRPACSSRAPAATRSSGSVPAAAWSTRAFSLPVPGCRRTCSRTSCSSTATTGC
jgi:hypothetical protein